MPGTCEVPGILQLTHCQRCDRVLSESGCCGALQRIWNKTNGWVREKFVCFPIRCSVVWAKTPLFEKALIHWRGFKHEGIYPCQKLLSLT